MTTLNNNDVYLQRKQLKAIETAFAVNSFFRKHFFKGNYLDTQSILEFDYRKGKRTAAELTNPKSKYKVEKEGFKTLQAKFPYTRIFSDFTVDDTRYRTFGSDVYNTQSPEQIARAIEMECFKKLNEELDRLENKLCAELVFTGKIKAKGIGINDVLDCGYTTGEGVDDNIKILSGDDCWDIDTESSAFDIIDYIDSLRIDHLERCGEVADIMIMADDVYPFFRKHKSVKDYTDKNFHALGKVDPKWQGNGVSSIGKFPMLTGDLDIISVIDWYFSREQNKNIPIVPRGKILLASSKAKCEFHYGLIQNVECLKAVPRFPWVWTEKDGISRVMQLESSPLPLMREPDLFTVANVLSTATT
jgi:hypothetical protein